MFHSVI